MRKCGLALTVHMHRTLHFSSGLSAANGGRKTVSSNRRRPLCDHLERSLWSRYEKMRACLYCTCSAPSTSLLFWSPFSDRRYQKCELHGRLAIKLVCLNSWNRSQFEDNTCRLQSGHLPIQPDLFLILRQPCIWLHRVPRNLGIRLSVCTVSQHGRL